MGNAVSENNRRGNVENVNRSFHLRALTARSARSQGEKLGVTTCDFGGGVSLSEVKSLRKALCICVRKWVAA